MPDQRAEQEHPMSDVRPAYNGASGRPYPTWGVDWFYVAIIETKP